MATRSASSRWAARRDADYSVELCGGTHVSALGDIGLFKIVAKAPSSSGVRRIEALTGEAARQWLIDREAELREAAATLKIVARRGAGARRRVGRGPPPARARAGRGEEGAGAGRRRSAADAAGPEQVGGLSFFGQVIEGLDPKGLRGLVDAMKQRSARASRR